MHLPAGLTPPTTPPLPSDCAEWLHLPADVRRKLVTVRDLAGDRYAVLAKLMDEITAERQERQKTEARLQDIRRRREVTDDHPTVQQLEELRARNTGNITRLERRQAELSQSWAEAARLSESMEKYVRQNARSGVRLYKGAVPKLAKGEAALDGLEHAAQRGRTLAADRLEILARPYPSEVAKKLAHEQIKKRADSAQPDVSGLIDRLDPIQFRFYGLPIEEQAGSVDVCNPDPIGLMMWMFTEQFLAAIDRQIDAEADDAIALTTEQRIEKLQVIDGDILASAREEMFFAELSGLLPRSDLDPRAVLNLADEMPTE